MRVYNFSAGPSTLPLEVLKKAQEELLDFVGTGMSVTEISHRDKAYEAVVRDAEALTRELLGVPDDYAVIFVLGRGEAGAVFGADGVLEIVHQRGQLFIEFFNFGALGP